MKKLMIVLAAVAMVAGAQANTLLWGINPAGGALDTTKFASATAYLMYSSSAISVPTATDGAASYSTADLTAGTQLVTGNVADGAFSSAGDVVTSLSGKAYFYMAVISDDGKYMAISTSTKTTNMANNTNNTNLKWSAAQFTVYSASAVPEPTSGLLMLVGLGALALRRRRA